MFGSIIGVATISGDAPESLVLVADQALCIAKQKGKKPVISAVSGEMRRRKFDADQPRLKLESYLPNACIGAKS